MTRNAAQLYRSDTMRGIVAFTFLLVLGSNLALGQTSDERARYVRASERQRSGTSVNDQSADAAVSFTNGGFETGDFSGWVAGDNGLSALEPWGVCPAFTCGFFGNNDPIEGVFDANNGFDGEANYTAFLYQDVTVSAGGGTVSLWDRIQYDSLAIPSILPRIYEIQIRDLGNNVLAVVHHQEVVMNGAPFTDLGWQNRVFDVSAYTGQTIRIYIELFVPEDFTGPAMFEVDDFELLGACALDVSLSFSGTTLNMDFVLASDVPVDWDVWLFFGGSVIPLWSIAIPAIPSIPVSVPFPNFPDLGTVLVLTTLSSAADGILCWDIDSIDTSP